MVNLKLSISLCSTAMLCIYGCGGASSLIPAPATGNTHFNGTTTVSTTSTTSATVPATGGTTVATADTGTGGTAVIPSGAVPSGTTLPSGTNFAVIPLGTGFAGSFPSGSTLSVNGVSSSGIGVSGGGFTTLNAALPVAPGAQGSLYTLTFPLGDLDTRILTIHSTVFTGRFYVLTNPIRVVSPVPVSIAGRIPNNGENAQGANVQASFGPGNNGRTATLTIDYGNGFVLSQTQSIASGGVLFHDITSDASNVPQHGILTLSLAIGDI